jgi:hypothetical protein
MTHYKIFFIALITLIPSLLCAQDYIVGERDVLRITVYDNPDLTTITRVSGEGTILFPLIGEVNGGVREMHPPLRIGPAVDLRRSARRSAQEAEKDQSSHRRIQL